MSLTPAQRLQLEHDLATALELRRVLADRPVRTWYTGYMVTENERDIALLQARLAAA